MSSSHSSNPHPYAIKTTSTGILSRSNSSRSATAAHHFVPSSPTKPTSTHPRPINHRYSSSLNSNELPRPLPVPPTSDFDNKVLYTRDRRADTLPSTLSQPNLFGIDDDLPDDPRTWSPSDLSTYLSASLRLTSADLPPLVVHDITAFVRTQKLTGKKFLRLTDGDLDAYDLNQRWQNALLRASRVLRQDSIRGRVWNTSFLSGEDDPTYSSTSSSSSLNGKSLDAQRGRRESNGRVKGMIASFERSSSPTKSTSSASTSSINSRNISPTKSNIIPQSRPRPQSDIIPSRHPMDTPEYKKESRMLPYPPSNYGIYAPVAGGGPPALLPQDTSIEEYTPFPSGVLPFSPQSTGTMSISSPDYHISGEALGFPPQQPAQPQSFTDPYHIDNTNNSNGTSRRRLPFPPHSGQYYQQPSLNDDEGIQEEMRLSRGMMMVSDEPEHVVINDDDDRNLTSTMPVPFSLSLPLSLSPQPHFSMTHQEILSPQPRFGTSGRESPTKVLEEKLEELLEPRPRSRIVVSKQERSRVVSEGRPRSRVASMNVGNGSLNGSLRGKKGNGNGSRVGTPVNGSLKNVGGDVNEGDDNGDIKLEEGTQQPRTRVVSISSRNHAHRLSGVEVWGETHPHYHHHNHHHHLKKRSGIPFGNSNSNEEEVEGFTVNDPATTGGGEVKEEEEESVSSSEDGEIGNIDAVLEKSESLLTKEPKSSVITVLERVPSRLEEEEESVEALLEKEEGMGMGMSMVGGEAWESIGEVETVKRVVVDGLGGGEEKEKEKKGGIEDVFSGKEEGGWDVVGEGGKDEGDRDDSMTSSSNSRRSSGGGLVTTGGLNETSSTSAIGKNMRLRKKARKSDDVKAPPLPSTTNAATMTEGSDRDDDNDEIEVLREKVKEMREMVEDVRGRLGNVEMWIEGYERRVENKEEEEEEKKDKVQKGSGNRGLVMKLVKGFSTLLLGYPSSLSTNTTTTTRAHHHQPLTLARRMKKWGLNLSSCVVLFGIGMCMVVLRMLGRRPGGGGFGVGRMVGHGVMTNNGRR